MSEARLLIPERLAWYENRVPLGRVGEQCGQKIDDAHGGDGKGQQGPGGESAHDATLATPAALASGD